MMSNNKCRCPHHVVSTILSVLALVAGVLFFWSSWATRTFWGFDAAYWAWSVVVLAVMSRSMKCKCCCGDAHCQTCQVEKKMM